jgi:tripartite-type tricarboxylate transporter receptor subunit TctC
MLKRLFLVAAAICLTAPAFAQAWPSRPVRVVVNIAPGGIGDVVARLLGKSISDSLGQQLVVENRGGGDGYIGAQAVASAAPDGYTFLVSAGSTMLITPHIAARPDFIPIEELLAVAPTVRTTLTLATRANFPAKTFADFIAYARSNPGKVSFGSAGNGTGLHIAGELLKKATRTDMLHVPYRGAGPALNDLLGGHIDFIFDPGVGLEHSKAGRLQLLATTGAVRHPDFPSAPTFKELGLDVDSGPYFGYYAPKGTPRDIVLRLNAEVNKAMQVAEVRQRLGAMGLEPTQMTPDHFVVYLREQNQRYGNLVRELGLDKKPQ